jgi:hypothetical protein
MLGKAQSALVGDDDSGPEDALDDLDLECALLKMLIKSTLFQ